MDLFKLPGVAETIDWAEALIAARPAGARPRDDQRHARRAAEVPGRHRQDPGQRGEPHPEPGQGRAVRLPHRLTAGMVQDTARYRRSMAAGCRPTSCISPAACARPACRSGRARCCTRWRPSRPSASTTARDFYWTLHAVFVNRRDQRELFDQAFHVFWRNPELLKRMMALLLPSLDAPSLKQEGPEMSGGWPRRSSPTGRSRAKCGEQPDRRSRSTRR